MFSLTPQVSIAVPTMTPIQPSAGAASSSAPHCAPLLRRSKGLWSPPQRHCFLSVVSRQHGLSKLQSTRLLAPRAMDMSAGQSDGSGKLNLDAAVDSLRNLWSRCPEPVKRFPWMRTSSYFVQLIFELVVAVAKYLCIPVLAVSSLSEMSYCAHERKMLVIPIPFLAGIAVAKILKETAVEQSPSFKELESPWHLLLLAAFFMLLKLPGPYYPYWGRLSVPHFANGGLWSTLWFVFSWYRSPRDSIKMSKTSEAESQQE
uniref:Uncharacterized protein n=1 Tax=Anthurium amnicola TaxID=1678845 RepID=A0A1D1XNN1_9ARAE